MIFLAKLILAHLIGDFLLQPDSWVAEKEEKKIKSPKFLLHNFIHGALVVLLLWDSSYWLLALLIVLIHGAIDLIKLYFQNGKNKVGWFFIDQGLHLASILLLWYLWFTPDIDFNNLFNHSGFWVYTTALVFITFVAGILMRILLEKWSVDLDEKEDSSLRSAGKYIGILERLFVFTFIVTTNWSAIGFLITAKSVFRYGDLRESKNRKLTEYILIGTLVSFAIAIATGMLVLRLIG